jgi:putative hydrolase of the HAD superfamily
MSYTDEITTLAFDWGGTLMLEDSRFNSAMVDWPEVAAVDGIREALQALKGHYRMVVVTNATESNAALARAALARVGLDSFFSDIFTFNEVKARKPDPRFFRGVESALGTAPHHMAMVGDYFWADVVGACQAGWRAMWFNPQGEACPGLIPPHSAELVHMADLPAALNHPLLPDLQTCHLWCLEQGFSFAAWQHVSLVAAIAYQLAVWLRARGHAVDPILAQRGGLLHDLAKISAQRIATSASHGEVGASLLRERGQPDLAEIARRHMIRLSDADSSPRTWEEKLVHFADRLAEGSRLVSLDERLRALCERYPPNAASIHQQQAPEEALQAEICQAAGIAPENLFTALQTALKGN